MILTTRPARMEDAEYIGANLRAEDAREVETASGLPAAQVVPASLRSSREAYVWHLTTPQGSVEDKPCAIFGIANDPEDEGCGIMWMLSTPAISKAPLSILREAKHWLDYFNTLYPRCIHNLVDSRNDLHLRWLLLSGFTFADTCYLIRDVPFIHAMRSPKTTLNV